MLRFGITRLRNHFIGVRLRSHLVGRDIVDLRDLQCNDIRSLIWGSLDLKASLKGQKLLYILQGKHITLLLDQPDTLIQTVAGRAVSALGGSLTIVVNESFKSTDRQSIQDLGRALSTSSDVILVHSQDDSFISKLADGANVPTVAWRSENFSILQALSDVMTTYEHFKVLSPLTVSWVGPTTALFNTFLFVLPRMKINFRFCCNDSDSSSVAYPSLLNEGIKNAILNKVEIHQCYNPAEAVYRTDVIVTTGHDIPSLALVQKDVEEASLEFILLHDLPRGKSEVSDKLFRSKHSATWKSRENLKYIVMSALVNLIEDYKPSPPPPKWEIE